MGIFKGDGLGALALAVALCAGAPPVAFGAEPGVSSCAQLAGLQIPASSIGLPTAGAVTTSARMVEAGGIGNGSYLKSGAHGQYCRVSGDVFPVNPNSTSIKFEIALPENWNSKIVMLGGAGFDGVIPNVEGNFLNTPAASITPLARGYAVFGGDGGHQNQAPRTPTTVTNQDDAFLGDDEAYRNYLGDALKKIHDVALIVIEARYGALPTRSYFLGGSKGGGEALTVAGRWPQDWDGIVALYPARNWVVTMLGMLVLNQAMAAPDAFLNLAKRGLLYQAALAACDGLDGVRDGVISDVSRCYQIFDPSTAILNGAPLRCPGGADTGDTCLSDAQLAALETASRRTSFGFLGNTPQGAGQAFGGFNALTADLGGSSRSPLEALIATLTIGRTKPSFPTAEGNAMAVNFTDHFMRFAVARDAAFDHLSLSLSHPGSLTGRLKALSALDQVDTVLTGFAERGGKLLIVHGTDDMLISPRGTEEYVRNLKAAMGEARVDSFLRYYEIPGFGHSASTIYNAALDQLSAMENWVEHGVDPANNLIVTDTAGVPGRTRPLCVYPTWPRYNGSGNVDDASSFSCRSD